MPEAMNQVGAETPLQSRHFWVALCFAIVGPVAFQNSLEVLKFTSTASVVIISFVTVIIIMYSIPGSGLEACSGESADCVGEKYSVNPDTMEVFGALPIYVFAFTCQQNTFPVVNELINPVQPRVDTVMVMSIGTAFSVFYTVAVTGFITYGAAVNSDVLQSYPETGLTTTVRILISLLVAFTYPLQCNPSRRSLLNLWRYFDNNREPTAGEFKFRYITITVVFLTLSFIIAMSVTSLGVMLALVGATGSTAVSYILPGGFYYALHKDDPDAPKWKVYLALAQGTLGCIMVPTLLSFVFMGHSD